jgi:hypothetical protein
MSAVAQGKVLFFDDFEDGKLNPKYEKKQFPGDWEEAKGVVSQNQENPNDPTYLIVPGDFPEPHTALVAVRVNKWEDHDLARTGLGFRNDVGATGEAYAFLIHHTLDNIEFLNDKRAWKQNDRPPPFKKVEKGKWYWMKATISDDGINGKIWPVGDKEPSKWLMESKLDFGGLRPASGSVGLNGGSSRDVGKATFSFDNFLICDKENDCTAETVMKELSVEATGKLPIQWGKIKSNY